MLRQFCRSSSTIFGGLLSNRKRSLNRDRCQCFISTGQASLAYSKTWLQTQFVTAPLRPRIYGFLQRRKVSSGMSAVAITELAYPPSITREFLSPLSGCTVMRFRVAESAWRFAEKSSNVTAAESGWNRVSGKVQRSTSPFQLLKALERLYPAFRPIENEVNRQPAEHDQQSGPGGRRAIGEQAH